MGKNISPENNKSTIGLSNEVNANVSYHSNVNQSIITITEDKVELILRDHLKKATEKNAWTTPFGVFFSLLLTAATTEGFKPIFWHIPAASWETIIYLAVVVSGLWLLKTLHDRYKNRDASIKNIIKMMKNAEDGL